MLRDTAPQVTMPPKKKKAKDVVSESDSSSSSSSDSEEPSRHGCYVMGNMKLTAGQSTVNQAEILNFPTREPSFTELDVGVRQVSGGLKHVVMVGEDGKVYGWGCNANGQLGLDPAKVPYTYRWTLIKQLAAKKVVKVACGANHTLALTQLGMVFAMGANNHGQLGTTLTKAQRFEPQPVPKLCLVKDISAGGDASYAVDKTGDLFMWGLNKAGMCGVPEYERQVVEKPMKIPTFEELSNEVEEVSAGPNHVVARSGSLLYVFGCGEYGKLGLGDINPRKLPTELNFGHGKAEGPPSVTCSAYATLILTKLEGKEKGHTMLRGCGRLGPSTEESVLVPKEIRLPDASLIKKVQGGKTANAYLTEDGHVYTWGPGPHGLFHKHVVGSKRTEPQRVTMLEGKKVVDFVMTEMYTMVFTDEGGSENKDEELKIPVFGRYPPNPLQVEKKFTYETCRKRFKISCEDNKTCDDCSEASYDGPTREVVGASSLKVGDEISLWVDNVWAWAVVQDVMGENKFQVEWVREDWKEDLAVVDLMSENEDVDCESPDRWTYGFYEYWDSDSSSSSSEEDDDEGSGSDAASTASKKSSEKSEEGSSSDDSSQPPPKKIKAARKPAAKRGGKRR
eukprot:TRINITY_DN8775_c0_g1_i5.p1 TRINITY_DN8775_c0_g1~~TRINITY_DN8775_c0_g1_i5.p1  ORF type:complete len:621 (+),score=231.40 TRINITY_DN8775_c0_g1_i5:995-2857(+)